MTGSGPSEIESFGVGGAGLRRIVAVLLAGLGLLALLALSGASAAPPSSDPSRAFWSETGADPGAARPRRPERPCRHSRDGRPRPSARSGRPGSAARHRPERGQPHRQAPPTHDLASCSGRRLPAVRTRAVGAHGAGARREAPGHRGLRGPGIDDPGATIYADLTPLGFHASVRSPGGAWYIDPYYHLDQSVYASYFHAAEDDRRRSWSATPMRPRSRWTRATTTQPTP